MYLSFCLGTTRSKGRTSHLAAAGHYGRANEGATPLPPPLIEAMELAPGVVVKEGDRVKRGPRQVSRSDSFLYISSLYSHSRW